MSEPKRPEGYREPTEEEMQCLPEGVKFHAEHEWAHAPNLSGGKPHVLIRRFLAVPITQPSTDPKGDAGKDKCPSHYAGKVTPWDLQKCMKSSGNAFVDARRTDAIEYCFRMKDDLLGDLKKARHCMEEAIKELESQTTND